jgi:hypothetical protein
MANPSNLTTSEFLAEYGTAPKPDGEKPTCAPPPEDVCAGCGCLHMGLTARLTCMTKTIHALRAQLAGRKP